MLAAGGFITYKQSRAEAKNIANKQMEEYIEKHGSPILENATKQLEQVKQELEATITNQINTVEAEFATLKHNVHTQWELSLKSLQEKAENDMLNNKSLNKQSSESTLTQDEVKQLQFATTLKPQNEYSYQDWYKLSTSQYIKQEYTQAIGSITQAIQAASQDTEANQVFIAKALFRKALYYWQAEQPEDEITTYDVLIKQFSDHSELEIQEQVAQALLNKGITLRQAEQPEKAIATYNALLEQFSDHSELAIQEQVAKALFNKGFALEQVEQPEKAIATYDALLEQFSDHSELAIQERVAKAMVNKGVALGQIEQPKKAIATYNVLLEQFSNHSELAIQEAVAKAMVNKGVALGQIEQPEKAIATYNALLEQFSDHSELAIQEQVVKAMVNKGGALGQVGQPEKAIATFDVLIKKFGSYSEPTIQKQIFNALANSAEISLLCESSEDSLRRITACENYSNNEEFLSVMQFLRFLLNDKTLDNVITAIHAMPNDMPLTWSFAELKSYIKAHCHDEKLQQCQYIIAFFEQHQNKEQLQTELSLHTTLA